MKMGQFAMSAKSKKSKLSNRLPKGLFAKYTNFINSIKGYKHRIKFIDNTDLMEVSDNTGSLYICRRNRVWLYKKSVSTRLAKLPRDYRIDGISERLQGVFIDCGANVGELGHFAKMQGLEYHPFEPEQLEASCCDMNNFGGEARTVRKALWHSDAELTFYSKPDNADSSVFEISDFVVEKKVEAITLDSYIQQQSIKSIAVFKLEAEGAEPEILQGAKNALAITQYVAVDCGFERGLKQESTLVEVINILTASGFTAIDWNSGRITMLFKNMAPII